MNADVKGRIERREAVSATIDTRIGQAWAEAGVGGLRRVSFPEVDTARLLRLPLPGPVLRALAKGALTPATRLSSVGLNRAIIGPEQLSAGEKGVARSGSRWAGADPQAILESVLHDLKLLFEGDLDPRGLLFDYPIDLTWCGDFTRLIMIGMASIPPGSVTSYGALAAAARSPRAARAAGSVVGANPLGVVVPCHRVIGANGALTGFGGGLPLKVALLGLEEVAVTQI
jgi:methylated-DNA-[protein]-cysteine S-methyltransferase